jgi:hypothetical protein
MRLSIIAIMLLASACSPSFKAGDCYQRGYGGNKINLRILKTMQHGFAFSIWNDKDKYEGRFYVTYDFATDLRQSDCADEVLK